MVHRVQAGATVSYLKPGETAASVAASEFGEVPKPPLISGIMQPVNPMRRPATARQREVFDFICECWRRNHPPTWQEIAVFMGTTTNAAVECVEALVKKGWLKRGQHYETRTVVPVTYTPEE